MTKEHAAELVARLKRNQWAVLLYVARDGHRARAVVRRVGGQVGMPARLRATEFDDLTALGLRADYIVFDWMGRPPQGLERAKAAAIVSSRLKYGGVRLDAADTLL